MSLIDNYFSNLTEINGIYSADSNRELSYPKEGNDIYFNIENESFWFKHRNDCIISLVKKHSPNQPFFDIGGGNGFVSVGLHAENIETVLIEPGIHGCMNAKARGIKNIICSTLEESGCNKNSLPAIGLFDVVEHIENDKQFISSEYNYLQDNGFVYITVPSYQFLWSYEDVSAGHFRRYTRKQLERLLEKEGFKIHFSSYFFSFLVLPIWLKRSLVFLKSKQKSVENDHKSSNKIISGILQFFLTLEKSKINKLSKIKFGSSCIVVAQKTLK